ncbi:MAG: hypothetical protein HQK77_09730 [Desulfobacterales bacterium]|nr:hypothetical protein [Desulfobacterales bacterium]
MKLYLLLLLFFIVNSHSTAVHAETKKKILVINSDSAVETYRVVQDVFIQAINQPVIQIDLHDQSLKMSDIEEKLYDIYPDISYCIGTKAYMISHQYIREKSIVFSSIINYLRLPMTANRYGISNEIHPEIQITLFHYIFPTIQKIGLLYSKEYTLQWYEKTVTEAQLLGIKIIGEVISSNDMINRSLNKLIPEIDAYWLISDPVIISQKEDILSILKRCDTEKKPVFSYHDIFIKYGATLIISVDHPTIGRQVAGISEKLLKGQSLEENIQWPAGSDIKKKKKKVKEYGLNINKEALGSVNKIIE